MAKAEGAILLIAKLDRLARNVHFLTGLQESGIEFTACDMPQADRFTVHIMAALAEREAELISQRTKDALASAKARGAKLGNPSNLNYEAQCSGARTMKEQAEMHYRLIAPYIHSLREKGLTYRQIADRLNHEGHVTRRGKPWSVSQVQNVLGKY